MRRACAVGGVLVRLVRGRGALVLDGLEVLAERVFTGSVKDGRRLAGHIRLGGLVVGAGVGVLHLLAFLLSLQNKG